jgi:hypothetical protein
MFIPLLDLGTVLTVWFFVFLLDLGTVLTVLNKNTTLSEQFLNLTGKQKYHTVRTVPKSNRKTKYHTVWTVLKSNRKIKIPHCQNSGIFVFLLDLGTVLTVWFLVFLLDLGTVLTVLYFCFPNRFRNCSDSMVFLFSYLI